eukprot:gnl/TRDRNA2_/TRDRNA2_132789_c0_seq1.p1 gnl/TRDRNA2_/TRDRNA2_132789_c0~~gnl/TRDRNA2_/TRDRNA2_132789_c0_seq1.p1  ORF type:complete len:385 (-),score=5.49 gnl/TRDRNA2_/TRDRNA2_132789_c0_seq1:202-1356(-)
MEMGNLCQFTSWLIIICSICFEHPATSLRLQVADMFGDTTRTMIGRGKERGGSLQTSAGLYTGSKAQKTMTRTSDVIISAAQHGIFNVAFHGSMEEGGLMIGPYLWSKGQDKQCHYMGSGHDFGRFFAFARWSPPDELSFLQLEIPANVVCRNAGEPKWVQVNGHMYIYSYGSGCNSTMWDHLPAGFKKTYAESVYKSYLMKFDPVTTRLSEAMVLATEGRVAPRDAIRTNYAFFEYGDDTFAITLPCPHRVHKGEVDLSTGLMVPAYESACNIAHVGHPLGLGANPVDLGDGTFLVAGHIRKNESGSSRQTFFYKMEAKPPFKVIAHTPAFSFGLDAHLEYITSLHLIGDKFVIAVGVKDCNSVVIEISRAELLSHFAPKTSP